jgi:hypothetical protein
MSTLWDNVIGAGEHEIRLRDLTFYAEECLRIRPKIGGTAPLVFNAAQLELHRRLEEQLKTKGMVRAIILKGRQMGCSTYVASRLFKKTTETPGLRTIIIAHERQASNNLFRVVKRFGDLLPEDRRPSIGTSNQQELQFDKIDSGYVVATATEEGAGRSDTAQCLHGSECAFWVDMSEQLSALLQTVPRIPGSEVILESTAKEFGDAFHQLWRSAETGESEFIPIFLPWTLDPGYRAAVGEDFARTSEEKKLAELHGLDDEQIFWRRLKIAELRSEDLFKREYPLTAAEAFIAADFDSFISPELVMAARKTTDVEPYGPLVIGVDPAGKGADSTAIAWRQGHCITKVVRKRGLDTMEVCGWISQIIREDDPAQVNIDVGGLGVGVYDRLVEQGHGNVATAVNFGGKPVEPPPFDEKGKPAGGPLNRRSEMWGFLKEALQEGRFSLPDSDSLQADLCSVGYKFDSSGRLVLEAKADLRKRGMPSPDEADAVALCFATPIGSPAVTRVSNFNRKLEYFNYVY